NGLDRIIEKRTRKSLIGFNAQISSKKERKLGELLQLVEPEDLVKFGMIPEFSGRIPVLATLHDLNREDLIRILVEPKNAIIRQYEKLFDLEKVKLRFKDDALASIAELAIGKETGARGLRAILEEVMLDLMYEIPSRKDVQEVIITEGVIQNKEEPLIVYEHDASEEVDDGRSAMGQ
ncbi:MAG: ATP-dependent Clp protease ATP-binding subunit ClpX, partial [Candidatus Hydrogenedentes bacterium]|nr:ATP-dependent Clp protease ATP-binding subunit ClpX [Candidatus Hydrogenedentota bacterium]